MKACKYDPLFERSLLLAGGKRTKYTTTETKFAEDMLFQAGEMNHPYIDKDSSAAHIKVPNSWNKTYSPQFQIKYSSFKEKSSDDQEKLLYSDKLLSCSL